MVDQVRSPFWGECVSNGCNRLMKGRGQFMLGLSDLRVRAEAPGGKLSIGRVAEHHVNACCRQQCVNLAEVAFNDLDAILQSVELRSPPSPVGQGSLDLKPGYAKIRIPIGQQEGDRAVSAAEIKDLIGGSRYGKFRQQQRIHRMVEARQVPDNLQTRDAKIIQGFALTKPQVSLLPVRHSSHDAVTVIYPLGKDKWLAVKTRCRKR